MSKFAGVGAVEEAPLRRCTGVAIDRTQRIPVDAGQGRAQAGLARRVIGRQTSQKGDRVMKAKLLGVVLGAALVLSTAGVALANTGYEGQPGNQSNGGGGNTGYEG